MLQKNISITTKIFLGNVIALWEVKLITRASF
jgi:hypothetical protein